MWCAVFTREQGAWFPNGFSMGHAQLSTMLDPLWHLKESSWYWFDWALSVFHVWIPEMVMVKHSCHKHSLQKKTSSCWVLGVLVAFPQPHKTNRDLDTADIFNWKGHAFSWPLMATDLAISAPVFACGLDILGILKEKEEPKSQSDHVTLSIFPIHGQVLANEITPKHHGFYGWKQWSYQAMSVFNTEAPCWKKEKKSMKVAGKMCSKELYRDVLTKVFILRPMLFFRFGFICFISYLYRYIWPSNCTS